MHQVLSQNAQSGAPISGAKMTSLRATSIGLGGMTTTSENSRRRHPPPGNEGRWNSWHSKGGDWNERAGGESPEVRWKHVCTYQRDQPACEGKESKAQSLWYPEADDREDRRTRQAPHLFVLGENVQGQEWVASKARSRRTRTSRRSTCCRDTRRTLRECWVVHALLCHSITFHNCRTVFRAQN